MLTTSTNRNVFQPTKGQKRRRRSEIERGIRSGKRASNSATKEHRSAIAAKLTREASTSGSSKSGRSQLVDLVVEDADAEEVERVRARKEGGPAWNQEEQKHFVRTYEDEDLGEDIRQGFEPSNLKASDEPPEFAIGEDPDEGPEENRLPAPALSGEERNPWDSPGRRD